MRIVGGIHRGRILSRVLKNTTRETADMVKVAVFNMLENQCHGTVLDLFAGSGAYGIEAISRGAEKVYFVDMDRDAIKTVEKNIAMLKEDQKASLHLMDYARFIEQSNKQSYDYIFLDPPYQMNIYEDVIKKLEPYINEPGYVICESDKKVILPGEISSLNKIKDKTYGIKRVTIFKK